MKTSTLLASLVVVVAATVTGCGASLQTTQLAMAPHPMAARTVESVELITSGAPQRPHVDVALFEIEQSSDFSLAGTPEMLQKLRVRGAAMGCDAVVVGGPSRYNPGGRSGDLRGFTATCISYTL